MAKAELASKYSPGLTGLVLHLSENEAQLFYGMVGHVHGGYDGPLRELANYMYYAMETVYGHETCLNPYNKPVYLADQYGEDEDGD